MEIGALRNLVIFLLLAECVTAISEKELANPQRESSSNQQPDINENQQNSGKQQGFFQRVEIWYYSFICSVWGVFPTWVGRVSLKVPLLKDRIVKVGPPPSCAMLILTVEYTYPSGNDIKKLRQSNLPVVWVLGGPGSGKGTLCKMMADSEGFTHISVGDLIRREVSKDPNSLNSRLLDSTMKQGVLLPEPVAQSILVQEMVAQLDDSKGFLIDGFPRSLEQAKLFQNKVKPPNAIIFLVANDEVLKKRVLSRQDGRADDNEETIKKRLEVFHKRTQLVVSNKMFADKVKKVSAEGDLDENFQRFTEAIHSSITTTNADTQ